MDDVTVRPNATTWTCKPIAISDRTTLNVEIRGEGPATVFLHGIGGRARQWRGVTEQLATPACAIVWDARGYGDSTGPAVSAFSDFADDLVAVLDMLHVERALCVGHSMGGRILIEAAVRQPDRFGALFISGAPAAYLSHLTSKERDDYMARRLAMFEEGMVAPSMALEVARGVLPTGAPDHLATELAEDFIALRRDGYGAALTTSAGWDRSDDLDALAMPCELLGGALDRVCPPSSLRALAAAIDAEKVTLLEGVAHMAPLEAPSVVAALVSDFIVRNGHRASLSSAAKTNAAEANAAKTNARETSAG